ncbi:hypothetical protein DMENIID0001_058800 [Sergentomyia squamirostris]
MKYLISCVILNIFIQVNCNGKVVQVHEGNEYWIGKYSLSDDELFYNGAFDLKPKECSTDAGLKYCNNETHFTLDYKTPKTDSCISAIFLHSYPDDMDKVESESSVFCQKGGIGKDHCFLVFRKKEKRDDARIRIYGIPSNKECSLHRRYLGRQPEINDAFGMPYVFDRSDNWTVLQSTLPKYHGYFETDIFQYKHGLINKQIQYLDKSDKYRSYKERFPNTNNKKFIMKIANKGKRKISFLDVYWYQESKTENPKMPYIYYKGSCDDKTPTCTLVFDTDEAITYVLVKIFKTTHKPVILRLRWADLGRGLV